MRPSLTLHPGASTLEILDLRHFNAGDLRPLLQEEARLWAQRMHWDYAGSAEMILRYVDAKILPGYAAVEDGRVRGYSFFVYEGTKGVIGDLFVEPAAASAAPAGGNGSAPHPAPLAEQLLANVIATLQQSPGIHRIEAQLLVHETGALAEPFQREGFRRFPRTFMVLPLSGELPPATPSRLPDLEFRTWREQDFQAAAAVITAAYRQHVDSEINDQYRTVAGSLRFLNNIVRFPGCGIFDAESSWVAVQKGTGAMAGVLLCSRVRDDVGHVTQVATLPEQRGRGIGQILIGKCAASLAARDFYALTLTVTEANARAVQLYRRLHFEHQRVFDAFVWEDARR